LHKRLHKFKVALSQHEIVIKLVQEIRYEQPFIGTEKIYGLIKKDLNKMNIKIGRIKLNSILKEYGLLVRKRRKSVITTNSRHRFRKYPNLIKEVEIVQPEQVWVADITYIRTDDGFNYLHLITDAYSKRIVGFELSDNLKAESTISALKMALKGRKYPDRKLTHHSDRGLQYCSDDYVQMLLDNAIEISMTENSDPYENAIAERVNGILKQEFSIGDGFRNHLMALKEIKKSIYIYNHKRPHRSCEMLTPKQAHLNGKYKLPSYAIKRKPKNELSLTKNC
jgi:transposase InsO family protein